MTALVVMTSTYISIEREAAEVFAGEDIEFRALAAPTENDVIRVAQDADAVLTMAEPITRNVIEQLVRAKSITRLGIGVDTIDVAAATEHNKWVMNVPDANYREVAVHAIALALAVTRRLPQFNRLMHVRGATPVFDIAAGTRRPDDQVFGIVGLGRIGRRVAAMATSIGYRVVAFDPALTAEEVIAAGAEPGSLRDVIAQANVLSLHVPLTRDTANMIDNAALAAMPSGSVLINVSRGGLVDEYALARAIRSGHLSGAGIDAYLGDPAPLAEGHPLLGLEKVILTPHSAHFSEESFREAKYKALLDVRSVLRGERPSYPVNEVFPLRTQILHTTDPADGS